MRITATVLFLIISLLMTGPAIAGPLEDATKACEDGDYKYAYNLFRPLAKKGLPEAQYNLCVMYRNGQGVREDFVAAAEWCKKAAEQDYAPAMYILAVMYRNGQGVPEDYVAAAKWCRKAAEQEYAPAVYILGIMYRKGQGVPQDYAEAAKWLGKAAEQEYAPAMYILGFMYQNGQGVRQDILLAHMWFNLAASLSSASQKEYRDQAATERDAIASKLTPVQIADAQRMAREWKPKKEKEGEEEGGKKE